MSCRIDLLPGCGLRERVVGLACAMFAFGPEVVASAASTVPAALAAPAAFSTLTAVTFTAAAPEDPDRRFVRALAELELPDALEQWEATLAPERAERIAPQIELARSRLALLSASGAHRAAMMLRVLEAHDQLLSSDLPAPQLAAAAIERMDDILRHWLEGEGLLADAIVGWSAPQERERLAEALSALRQAVDDAEVFADRAAREGFRADERATGRMALSRLMLAAIGDRGTASVTLEEPVMAGRGAEDRTVDLMRLLAARSALDRGEFAAAQQYAERVTEEPSARPLDRLTAALLAVEAQVRNGGAAARGNGRGSGAELETMLAAAYEPQAAATGAFGRLLAMSAALRIGAISAEALSGTARTARYAALADIPDGALIAADPKERVAVRALFRPRLDAAIPHGMERSGMPAIAIVAEGERLARDGQMEEAVRVLASAITRRPLDAHDAQVAAALLMQGHVLLGQPVEALRAVDSLLTAGGEIPDRLAFADQAARLAQLSGDDLRALADGAALQRRTFDRRIAAGPDEQARDHWRLVAADEAMAGNDLERAGALLQDIRSSGPTNIRAVEKRIELDQQLAQHAGQPGRDEQLRRVRAARQQVQEMLARTDEQSTAMHDELRVIDRRLLLREADLRIDVEGGASALRALAAMGDPSMFSAGERSQVLRLRVAALRAAGREGEAERDLIALLDDAIGSDASSEGAKQMLLSMLTDAVRRVRAAEREEGDRAAAALAERDVAPLARLAASRVDAATAPLPERVLVAEALRRSGVLDEALDRLEWLEREHPDAAEVLFNLAETLVSAGQHAASPGAQKERDARAMVMYRRLTAAGPRDDDDQVYWTAQLRMLELVERSGERTDQIAPRIRRLRAQDASLGGPALRRSFERLEQRATAR